MAKIWEEISLGLNLLALLEAALLVVPREAPANGVVLGEVD